MIQEEIEKELIRLIKEVECCAFGVDDDSVVYVLKNNNTDIALSIKKSIPNHILITLKFEDNFYRFTTNNIELVSIYHKEFGSQFAHPILDALMRL